MMYNLTPLVLLAITPLLSAAPAPNPNLTPPKFDPGHIIFPKSCFEHHHHELPQTPIDPCICNLPGFHGCPCPDGFETIPLLGFGCFKEIFKKDEVVGRGPAEVKRENEAREAEVKAVKEGFL